MGIASRFLDSKQIAAMGQRWRIESLMKTKRRQGRLLPGVVAIYLSLNWWKLL